MNFGPTGRVFALCVVGAVFSAAVSATEIVMLRQRAQVAHLKFSADARQYLVNGRLHFYICTAATFVQRLQSERAQC